MRNSSSSRVAHTIIASTSAPMCTSTLALDEPSQLLLFDAQTSGGLLLAVPPDRLEQLQSRAAQLDQPVWVIGEVIQGKGIEVTQ